MILGSLQSVKTRQNNKKIQIINSSTNIGLKLTKIGRKGAKCTWGGGIPLTSKATHIYFPMYS